MLHSYVTELRSQSNVNSLRSALHSRKAELLKYFNPALEQGIQVLVFISGDKVTYAPRPHLDEQDRFEYINCNDLTGVLMNGTR